MYKPPEDCQAQLNALNASFRFTASAGRSKRNIHGEWEPDPQHPGKKRCEIIDNTTGQSICFGESYQEDDDGAMRAALERAKTAPKPLTAAQMTDPNFVSAQDRIAALEKQLADAGIEPVKTGAPVTPAPASCVTPAPGKAKARGGRKGMAAALADGGPDIEVA